MEPLRQSPPPADNTFPILPAAPKETIVPAFETPVTTSSGNLGDPTTLLETHQRQAAIIATQIPLPPEVPPLTFQVHTQARLQYMSQNRSEAANQKIATIETTLSQAQTNVTTTPKGWLQKKWSQIITFFTGGFAAWRKTNAIQKRFGNPKDITTNTSSFTFSATANLKLLENTNYDDTFSTPIESAKKMASHGTFSGGDFATEYLRYIQKVTARQHNLAFEYETSGMAPQIGKNPEAPPPIQHLKAEKIAYLRTEAEAGRPSLYAIPCVFPGYIGHITTILIDFKSKEVSFFDSKGKSIDQADFAYSLPFSLRAQLEQIGHVCFDEQNAAPWTPKLKENTQKFQDDTVNCGRWVSRFLESAAATGNSSGAIAQLSISQTNGTDIEKFADDAKEKLISPKFFNAVYEDYKQYDKNGVIADLTKVETKAPLTTTETNQTNTGNDEPEVL